MSGAPKSRHDPPWGLPDKPPAPGWRTLLGTPVVLAARVLTVLAAWMIGVGLSTEDQLLALLAALLAAASLGVALEDFSLRRRPRTLAQFHAEQDSLNVGMWYCMGSSIFGSAVSYPPLFSGFGAGAILVTSMYFTTFLMQASGRARIVADPQNATRVVVHSARLIAPDR